MYFQDYGCVKPNRKYLTEYNKMVFKYLAENYDDEWIGIIREDLFGFNEWRENYKNKN
ncbi:FEKKY domain-containing protein [Winogradskyella litorisediminis]